MTETSTRDLGTLSHLDALLATVGPVRGLRILDIGCGEGHLARALAEQGARADAKNRQGQTALDVALARRGQDGAVAVVPSTATPGASASSMSFTRR